MKSNEILIEKSGYTLACNTYKAKSHYKFIMSIGRCFPTTKAQARFFVSKGVCLDLLNKDDVLIVEAMLNKHGFEGEYKYSKSKTLVRLMNNHDLHKALRLEYLK